MLWYLTKLPLFQLVKKTELWVKFKNNSGCLPLTIQFWWLLTQVLIQHVVKFGKYANEHKTSHPLSPGKTNGGYHEIRWFKVTSLILNEKRKIKQTVFWNEWSLKTCLSFWASLLTREGYPAPIQEELIPVFRALT